MRSTATRSRARLLGNDGHGHARRIYGTRVMVRESGEAEGGEQVLRGFASIEAGELEAAGDAWDVDESELDALVVEHVEAALHTGELCARRSEPIIKQAARTYRNPGPRDPAPKPLLGPRAPGKTRAPPWCVVQPDVGGEVRSCG